MLVDVDIATILSLKKVLEINEAWKLVAADFGYSIEDINSFGQDPYRAVDRMWRALESRNCSVPELEQVLENRQFYQPLEILRGRRRPELKRRKIQHHTDQGSRSLMVRSVSQPASSQSGLVSSSCSSVLESIGTEEMLRKVDFEFLKSCCDNFSASNILGKGGFGIVYRGRMDGQDVAVKCVKPHDAKESVEAEETFKRWLKQLVMELRCLKKYSAENILPLMAINSDLEHPCFVCPLMPNGSLADRLRKRGKWARHPALDWSQRMNIALGTAKGLTYLHAQKIYHCDIKSGNILLDKHYEARIGDFGLARSKDKLDEHSYVLVSKLWGTCSYLPLDYMRNCRLCPGVDTFCFGILMFEMITGKSPGFKLSGRPESGEKETMRELLENSDNLDPSWVDATDGLLPDHQAIAVLYDVGKGCARKKRGDRPPMDSVLIAFEAALEARVSNRKEPQMKSLNHQDVEPLHLIENHFDAKLPNEEDETMKSSSSEYNIPNITWLQ